jgi:aryl-alcohol dehydrogenase-like predicted oxidoreductase
VLHARAIPSTGEALPVIGLGTWQTFDVGQDASARAARGRLLETLVAGSARVVDSSPMYGRAEEVVGSLSSERALRSKLFVATKVWTTGRAAGERQMNASFAKLATDTIDLMQVHNLVDVGTHLVTLRDWKSIGRLRYIGVTHYTASAHAAVASVLETEPVDFVQINYSVAERDAERTVLPLAQARGVAVIVNRPLAEGALVQRLSRKPLPSFAAELDCTSWPQLLLKFVISHPAVTCAIPATASVDHLHDNLQAGTGPLPDAQMRERIAAAAA